MAEPFLGEIRLMSFGHAPKGWALCNGQFLPINQNQALFSLLGTMYGGNGQTTFALPDLRSRATMHVGEGFIQGQAGGTEFHTLTAAELPAHSHVVRGVRTDATIDEPGGKLLAAASNAYTPPTGLTSLAPPTVGNVGGSQAHENRQPFLVLNYCIALIGIFPSRD